jgi:two-component sensor histidine kinase
VDERSDSGGGVSGVTTAFANRSSFEPLSATEEDSDDDEAQPLDAGHVHVDLSATEEDSDDDERPDERPARSPAIQASVPPPPPAAPGSTFGPTPDQLAQADVRRREPQITPPQKQAPDERTATDATSGPLLIYQAILHLAVYQVQDNQRSVVAIARELEGYLAQQSDTIVVIRVPARRFQEALGRIEALGDVLHRNIQATDVSEEFRDTQIRLRNLEQVRDRLAALLAQARTVEESLQIERELERLTTEIESMKGRLRFLEDRIAFSTITVNFSPREQETLQGELFNLPFDFLYNLGLRTLLNLR